jgi:MFS family permease
MNIKQLMICISELLASMSYTILSSFYPGLAVSKGISLWQIGIIFSLDPLIGLPTSLIAGKYMTKVGRRFTLILGMSLSTLGIFLIALIEDSDYTSALTLSILSRLLGGIGAGCSMVAAPSILISEYPGETDKLIGYFEAFSGLGLLIGPILGSLFSLYSISLSFFISTGFYTIYTGSCYIVLRNLKPAVFNSTLLPFKTVVLKPVTFK